MKVQGFMENEEYQDLLGGQEKSNIHCGHVVPPTTYITVSHNSAKAS